MLELDEAGSAGTEEGVHPVLGDGAAVATVPAARWKEAAAATVEGLARKYAARERVVRRRAAAAAVAA